MPQVMEIPKKYILGIDLGSASLGWALVELDERGKPIGLLSSGDSSNSVPPCGVRIFEPGVDGTALDIERGKDQSKAVERRNARLHRRQLRRKAARQRDLFRLLQQNRLLPALNPPRSLSPSEERHEVLNLLDQKIKFEMAKPSGPADFGQIPLYLLRTAALDQKLEPHEIGRVIYHLIQRRGFRSNRRESGKSSESVKELGQVKEGISQLEQEMAAAKSRTLGEYFAGLNPHLEKIRRRWTARWMFEKEFEAVWSSQIKHYPEMFTRDLYRRVLTLLFFQRPIAAQSHLIGKCELEPGKRRAAWATLEAQRFRILQKVNDLRIIYPGNPVSEPLSQEQRDSVYALLDRDGDKTFAQLRTHLKLNKKTTFNLDRDDEKKLRGNRTNHHMMNVFGERWFGLFADDQKQIVEDWRNSESDDTLITRGVSHWGLDEPAARLWASKNPENGYCNLSRLAIARIMPLMLGGMSFKEAETKIYGNRFSGGTQMAKVPVVRQHLKNLRNPAVERALAELRKVVNAIIRQHGKPSEIRIELARELKKSRKEREASFKYSRQRQKTRDAAKERILKECGLQSPSFADVEKALLHDECGGICPYTGKSIPFSGLFHDSQFDVEHIIPLSRYPDDSFQNKTLCYHE